MPDAKMMAQVAVVETEIRGMRDDLVEEKRHREEIWKAFRKEQMRTNENEKKIIELLHRAETERGQIRGDVRAVEKEVRGYKKDCDGRFNIARTAVKEMSSRRMGVIMIIIAASIDLAFRGIGKIAERLWS